VEIRRRRVENERALRARAADVGKSSGGVGLNCSVRGWQVGEGCIQDDKHGRASSAVVCRGLGKVACVIIEPIGFQVKPEHTFRGE